MNDKSVKNSSASPEPKQKNSAFDDPVILYKTSPVLIGLTIITTILLDGFIRTHFGLAFFDIILLGIKLFSDSGDLLSRYVVIVTDTISNVVKDF